MIVSEFRQLTAHYELLIVDLWGVIHDGSEAYPNILETIEYLNQKNKRIVFLSNAPRRAAETKKLLDHLGISDDKYTKLLTSGEIAFNYLAELGRREGAKKYIFIGPERDLEVMSGAGHLRVNNCNEADFIVATGYELGESEDVKDEQLQDASDAGLFMYCFNPSVKSL